MNEQSEQDKNEMDALTKKDNERKLLEIQAETSEKDRDENRDVNDQISNFVGN